MSLNISATVYGFEKSGDKFQVNLVTLPGDVPRRRLGTVFKTSPRAWGGDAPDGLFSTGGHRTREAAARALHRHHFRVNPLA